LIYEFAIRNPKQVTDKLIQWKLMSLAEKSGIRIRGSDKKRDRILQSLTALENSLQLN